MLKKIIIIFLLSSPVVFAANIYCGKHHAMLIEVGDSLNNVLRNCGQPLSTLTQEKFYERKLPVKRWQYTDSNFNRMNIELAQSRVIKITQSGNNKKSIRCGYRGRVQLGDLERQVIAECGYPHHETIKKQQLTVSSKNVKTLVYNNRTRNSRILLTFVNNELTSIKKDNIK